MNVRRLQIIIVSGAVLAVGLYALLLIYLAWPINEISINKAGVFGDSFGILTSLFSALAFAGMFITILLQKEELGLQREELRETRHEIAEQKEIFRKQSFNDSFYKLLGFYKENLDNLAVRETDSDKLISGVSALKYLLDKFTEAQKEHRRYFRKDDEECLKVFEHHLYLDVHRVLMRQARYLGTFTSLLRLVDALADEEDRPIYWDIIESQLTVHEVKYIFYHCLIDFEGDFMALVLPTGILQNRLATAGATKSHLVAFQRRTGIEIASASPLKAKAPFTRKEIRKAKQAVKIRLGISPVERDSMSDEGSEK